MCYLFTAIGSHIEINETGTVLRFKPGILLGGKITHDCGLSRGIGWFVEGILPLAAFCKNPLHLILTGTTNDEIDMSVDILQNVTFPILQNFGIYGIVFKIKKRGVPPKGGGMVELVVPPVRTSLNPVYIIDEGLIKRVRGVAFCTRISPTIITRVIESCRKVLNDFLPDVHIHSDHYKGGKEGGDSPGYSLSLVAETTTGALLSVERTAKPRRSNPIPGTTSKDDPSQQQHMAEMPEDIGIEGAMMLMKEIFSGGVVDSMHQSLILQLMVLTPEDVSKVRFGHLSTQAIETLRIIRDAFGVVFRIKEEKQILEKEKRTSKNSKKSGNNSDNDEDDSEYGDFEDMEVGDDHEDENKEEEDDEMDENVEDSDDEEEEDEDEEEESDDDGEEDSYDDADESAEEEENDSSSEDGSEQLEDENEENGEVTTQTRVTYLLSCLGTGYTNVNRRAT